MFPVTPAGKAALLDSTRAIASGGIAAVTYIPSGIRAYHSHKIGKSWIPTAPSQAQGASQIEVQSLSLEDFISNLPEATLENAFRRRWFPEKTYTLGYTVHGEHVAIDLGQEPPIEGSGAFRILGKLGRPLSALDGKVVLEILMADYFGFGRRLRVYHDGHSEVRLGLQHSARFNSVLSISSDGVRNRFLYKPNQTRLQTATLYQSNPSSLYSFRSPEYHEAKHLVEPLRPDFLIEVNVLRKLESSMLTLGNAYDHGTIGAEVAFSIASRMLMNDQLLILEPAMRGSDIVSRDRSVAVEARMLAGSKPRTPSYISREVVPHMRQMLGRLRWGLSKRVFKRGIAVLCLRLEDQRVLACVREA